MLQPITDLLEATFEKIIWTIDCHASFRSFKTTLMEAPVLRIMDPSKGGLDLCTKAHDMTKGVILIQEGKVIAYNSTKLNNEELNQLSHQKHLLEIIHALQIGNHYLFGSEFKIETNHPLLRYFTNQANLNQKQNHWMV